MIFESQWPMLYDALRAGSTKQSEQRLLSITCIKRVSMSYLNFGYWLALSIRSCACIVFSLSVMSKRLISKCLIWWKSPARIPNLRISGTREQGSIWPLENVRPIKTFFLQKKLSKSKTCPMQITNSYLLITQHRTQARHHCYLCYIHLRRRTLTRQSRYQIQCHLAD